METIQHVGLAGRQMPESLQEDRHMKMDHPLLIAPHRIATLVCLWQLSGQILGQSELARFCASPGLVQIPIFGKFA